MLTPDQLLDGSRYRDVEVRAVTSTTLSATVDGEPVTVDLASTPALNAELQAVYRPGVERLRIAQADLASVRAAELDPTLSEAWLVVADPETAVRDVAPVAPLMSLARAASATTYAPGLTAAEIAAFPHLCALISQAVGDGGQSSSRNGATVDAFQIHHSTMLTASGYVDMVQSGSRQVSSNLAIDRDGRIIRVVNLTLRAWTSGSASFDARAITVETANATLAPDYRLSPEAKRSLARVAAAIAQDLGLSRLTRDNVYLHREMLPRWGVSYATACPVDTTAQEVIDEAERILVGATVEELSGGAMTINIRDAHNDTVHVFGDTWGRAEANPTLANIANAMSEAAGGEGTVSWNATQISWAYQVVQKNADAQAAAIRDATKRTGV